MGNEADTLRRSEVSTLTRLLTDDASGIRICGVNGVGGVGKTFLVDHVLASLDLAREGYLKLSLDGAHREQLEDFMGLIDGRLALRTLSSPADSRLDYFPRLRKVAEYHRILREQAQAELDGIDTLATVKEIAKHLLKLGTAFNTANPEANPRLNLGALSEEDADKLLDSAEAVLRKLHSLKDSAPLYEVRAFLGLTLRDKVRRDLYATTAHALVSDLTAAVAGYDWKDVARPTQPRVHDLRRLLVVIDDFEALAPTISRFLIAHLVPRLADARFPTVMIIIGRDCLEATDSDWGRYGSKYVKDEIRLHPFSEEDVLALLDKAGIRGQRAAELFERTQGLPFLLTLAIEEASLEDGSSFLFLRKFLDRTTSWMSPRERDWFVKVCYLDVVNEDTLPTLFARAEVGRVMDWFEREASIRDPSAPVPRVRPLIKDKVLRYQELRSPSRHRERSSLVSGLGEPDGRL